MLEHSSSGLIFKKFGNLHSATVIVSGVRTKRSKDHWDSDFDALVGAGGLGSFTLWELIVGMLVSF